MKPLPIILNRFEELQNKINDVEITRVRDELGDGINDIIFQEWANSVLSLLRNVFGEASVHYNNFNYSYLKFNGGADYFDRCKGIFNSAKNEYEGGYLFKIDSLISAEIFDDILEQAYYLLEKDYKDPACVIAGVSLEISLKKLCDNNSISYGKLDKMNSDLAKIGIYNKGMQKQITAWADRRNNAAHGNWDEYTKDDVGDMIGGIRRFIGEYF